MHVIAKSALVRFWEGQSRGPAREAAKAAMTEWHTMASNAVWSSFSDVKATFNSADYVKDGKIVFDIGGNKYRLVALIGFKSKRVFILFVGTHADYDRVKVSEL